MNSMKFPGNNHWKIFRNSPAALFIWLAKNVRQDFRDWNGVQVSARLKRR